MNRIESVDVFRIIAIAAVILIHTEPFSGAYSERNEIFKYARVGIDQLARFAVPFFFVISGYFWGVKIRHGSDITLTSIRLLKRLLILFLVWSFIYLCPYNLSSVYKYGVLGPIKVQYWKLIDLMSNPVTLLFQGTKVHLWFLVGLAFAVAITHLFISRGLQKSLIFFALSLYFFGLAAKAYSSSPIGIYISFNTRNGPFFSTIFFVTGYFLSKYKPDYRWLLIGFFVLSVGCFLHFSEIYFLWKFYNTSLIQDYVVGTYFMGLGVSMMALSNFRLFRSSRLRKISTLTLGIYAIHFIFIDQLGIIRKVVFNPAWEIAFGIIVLFLSFISASLLSKNKYTKKIVV